MLCLTPGPQTHVRGVLRLNVLLLVYAVLVLVRVVSFEEELVLLREQHKRPDQNKMLRPQVATCAVLAAVAPQEVLAVSKMQPPAQEAGASVDKVMEALRQEMQALREETQGQVHDLKERIGTLEKQNEALTKK